jgi:hypothetical protein
VEELLAHMVEGEAEMDNEGNAFTVIVIVCD